MVTLLLLALLPGLGVAVVLLGHRGGLLAGVGQGA
jgi:hypothetical protein